MSPGRRRARSAPFARWPTALLAGLSLACATSTEPDPGLYAHALADRAEFRAELASSCPELARVDTVIGEAISIGAPIYNAGSPLGCYRIYEGAAYKLLFQLEDRCAAVRSVLLSGLSEARADVNAIARAWTMRRAFDALLGEDTATRPTRRPL